MTPIEAFADRETLMDAAAEALVGAIRQVPAPALAVSGGKTPGPVFDRLSARDLTWERINVTLTDDRFVEPTSPDSNEHLVRQRLLVGKAARAPFVALKGAGPTPEADAAAAETRIRAILPFAAVLLGMGPDGHVASLFPGGSKLGVGLDFEGERLVIGVDDAADPPRVPRISLTARALVTTNLLVMLVAGDEKRAVIERIASNLDYAPPAASFLRQDRCPLRVLWAP
jgi:6-phosphogluconolactonase